MCKRESPPALAADTSSPWFDSLREQAEAVVSCTLGLLPLNGSRERGYRVAERIDPVLCATPEEWATAADAVARLHDLLRSEPENSQPEPMLYVDGKPYEPHGTLPAPNVEQLLEPDPERFLAGGPLHDPCAGECEGVCRCDEATE